MENQVLNIEQMKQLKEFGVDTSKASMAVYNIYAGEQKEYDILAANGAFAEKQEHDRFGYGIHNIVAFDKKPVFTLQDIIELLPATLPSSILASELVITKKKISYIDSELFDPPQIDYTEDIVNDNILDAAYNMLIWVIENGYLKTK